MHILYREFPESVMVSGRSYAIETDFREWIRFLELAEDEEVPWQIKCQLILQWFTSEVPEDIEQAIYALGDFCSGYSDSDDQAEGRGRTKPVILLNRMRTAYIPHSERCMVLICKQSRICTGGSFRHCF